ncbi:uncharacterized protein LOC105914108 [Setaria italica]|uniref:uncharacterized protein LOC105914108 n=1 Tax=Setaria italica TaxID=4555 RepID=UPI000645619B|nr:uncharacterized protein LOC105914108 [Setaria italica]
MKKIPYELLIGRKPNISYFLIFGCKCFIYKKNKHIGKFESCCDVGIFVGYSSNSKAYRVFNNATRVIEETCDVEFDESNGSQGDGFTCDDVGNEPFRDVIKKMGIGDIKPKEEDEAPTTTSKQVEASSKDETKMKMYLLLPITMISLLMKMMSLQDILHPLHQVKMSLLLYKTSPLHKKNHKSKFRYKLQLLHQL